MVQKILYFAYGANRTREMMEAITGNKNLMGRSAVLRGYKLCVQRLDQVPDNIAPSAPIQLSPRKILQDVWPASFESHIIKPSGKNDEVHGIVWELTPLEREMVRDWELVDFGWYKDMKVRVTTENGQAVEVQTEGLRESQEVDREISGRSYEPFLNPLGDFQRIAERSRREFLERLEREGSVLLGNIRASEERQD